MLEKNNILLGNNQVLQGFSEDGLLYNHKAIEVRQYLEILAVQTNQRYEFDLEELGFDFEPISIYAVSPVNLTGSASLTVNVIDKKTNAIIFPLVLTTQLNVINSRVLTYKFEPICVSQNAKLSITSNVALTQFLIYGEKRFINAFHKPTLVIPT
jgi:hypothetical protein